MSDILRSVGLDVGTTSTQMIFSELTVENKASGFAVPEMEIARRDIRYRSPVYFTPLLDESHVDAGALRELVAEEYRKAGIRRESVDTGAIIITGETSRKENARAVLDALSDFAGEFVVATAGPDLESVLAAKGAGAVDYSQRTGKTVLHMDIGGGTSNLALIRDGKIERTGCLNVGGRLLKFDGGGTVTYVSPVLEGLCGLKPGEKASPGQVKAVAEILTQALEMAAGLREETPLLEQLTTREAGRFDPCREKELVISFSGGVADLIEDKETPIFAYGDIGVLLGRAIRRSALCQGDYVLGEETIRATVIGAGCHSTQLSGSTVFARDVRFPLQNLPVLALTDQEQNLPTRRLVERIAQLRARWEEDSPAALFLPGLPSPGYDDLANLAGRLAEILPQLGSPAVVVTGEDMAKALGQALATRLPGPLLCLDGLELPDGSFLDVAAPVAGGAAYPVVKKTLVLA
mgnify:CR=1 FL=1